jgi:hypothetical protein
MSDRPKVQIPSVRILRIIAAGLEEIEGHFVWEGIARVEADMNSVEIQPDEGEYEEDSIYEDSFDTAGFDREDVEIAVDQFLSHLLRKRVIKKDRSGSLPLFSEVFEQFFGEQHSIARTAASFEDLIEGYFGRIDYENMKAAYDALSEIQKYIRKELETAPLLE